MRLVHGDLSQGTRVLLLPGFHWPQRPAWFHWRWNLVLRFVPALVWIWHFVGSLSQDNAYPEASPVAGKEALLILEVGVSLRPQGMCLALPLSSWQCLKSCNGGAGL